jgi:pimeloyl-ACP methyl ester carboxylesterase
MLLAPATVRRLAIGVLATVVAAFGCGGSTNPANDASASLPPILFVHGNGDSSALWITTIWRFESNGYPRDRLFAIDLVAPTARDDDAVEQANRSSTDDVRNQLSAKVDQVLARTKSARLALVANSRGANTVRNYLKNGGGAAKVGWAVLAGGVNHGVYSIPGGPNSEFNGAAAFMRQLNDGAEVIPDVKYLTIRSDKLDKYAQPELSPGRPSGISYDGPALQGATNVVLDGIDHRETAFSARAFVEMYKFLTGKTGSSQIAPEANPRLTGYVGGYENKAPTNKGVAGVKLTIYELDGGTGARTGAAVLTNTTGADGNWGTLNARPTAFYEFVVEAPGQPVRHFFRTPFPRSSDYVGLRLLEDAPAPAGKSLIIFTRPRGYIADGRDAHSLDGKPVPGVAPGVPTSSSFRVEVAPPERAVPASLNGEMMTVRSIPGEIVYAEFHY